MRAYEDAVRWACSLVPRGIRLELDRLGVALRMAGSPERSLPVIHVAGTNGKGSVSAMIERGLRENGLRTGLYTSPHLHTFTERIRIDGRPMSKAEAARGLDRIHEQMAQRNAPELTFFEVTTLLAFQTFQAHAVDVVVLEVGLGGRLDATNVIERPLCTVITRIAKDHQQYLGKTIAKIAGEKAGILKRGVVCVSGVEQPSARAVIATRADEVGAAVHSLGEAISMRSEGDALTVGMGRDTMSVRVPLAGRHQLRNAALAAAALMVVESELGLDRARSARGLGKTRWPGRLELVPGTPSVLLDAAHNPDGAAALAQHLRARAPEKRVLVFGAMRDKDWPSMLDLLTPEVTEIVVCAPSLSRAEDPAVLARGRRAHLAADVEGALTLARRLAGKRGLVVVCGSIFVLAAARAALLGVKSDPPIAM